MPPPAIRAHELDEAKALQAKAKAEEAMRGKLSAEEIAKVQAELAAATAQIQAI